MTSHRMPPLQWLHTYLAVVNSGSFSAAAIELHITQAAVSKQIRLLEHRVGEVLFDRHARGVRPNAAGKAILDRVNTAFTLLQGLEDDLQAGVRIQLCCDITYADAVLASRLDRLPDTPPGLAVVIATFVWADVAQSTYHDLSVLLDSGELPGLERTPLGPELSIMVASPESAHRWESGDSPTTLLMRVGQESVWDEWLGGERDRGMNTAEMPEARFVSDSSLICKRAALAGQGIALMRYSQVCEELDRGTLVRVGDHLSQHVTESYALYTPQGRRSDPARQAVFDWILDCHEEIQQSARRAIAC